MIASMCLKRGRAWAMRIGRRRFRTIASVAGARFVLMVCSLKLRKNELGGSGAIRDRVLSCRRCQQGW
jgi:hypothetical protein